MKTTILKLAILFAATAAIGQTELLTNSKIIEMTEAGLAPEIILLKIRSSAANFDISTDALIELKKAGVKDDVISAIVEKGRSAKTPTRPRRPHPPSRRRRYSRETRCSTPGRSPSKNLPFTPRDRRSKKSS